MNIQPPKWCLSAVLTPRGWADAQTGELLSARKVSDSEIADFYAQRNQPEELVIEQYTPKPAEMLTEAPRNNISLDGMTKKELLALGEQYGIELSPKDKKSQLVEALQVKL